MLTAITARLKQLKTNGDGRHPDCVQDALAGQFERDQFMSWVRHSYVMYPIGLMSAICLIAFMRSGLNDIRLRVCAASLITSYVVMIFFSLRILKYPFSNAESLVKLKNLRIKLGVIRAFIGSSWGATLLAMTVLATVDQRVLLFAAGVALLSTSVFGGSLAYGLTVWIPMVLSLIVSSIILLPQTGPAPLVCLCLFGLLTLFNIFDISKKLKDFTINGFELKSRNEIIKIVLNEFEEVASDWLWETNSHMNLVNLSPRLASILYPEGYQPEAVPIDLCAVILQSLFADEGGADVEAFVQRITARQSFSRLTLPVTLHGESLWWRLSGKPRFSAGGDFIGYHGVGSDITESHGFHQRIEYMARHDALTGMLNRARFNELLATKFNRIGEIETAFCLISLDLDNFKLINDTYGHAAGDEVLQIVAERIMQAVNFGDVVGRCGGDEFYVLSDCGAKSDGVEVAERVIHELNRPVLIRDTHIIPGASAGISFAPWDACEPKLMLKKSDLALYHAKKNGRNIACAYDEMLEFEMKVRAQLEADLQSAIYHNQFELIYQPIVFLSTGKIMGVEALIRWHHPSRGQIMPGEFIETAERTGLIQPIGRWAIAEACRVAASLPGDITMSVNLSPIQLRDHKLTEHIERALQITGLDPHRLEFEITETSVLDTRGSSLRTIEAIRKLGVRFALDDFGTGHSSLSLLHRIKFHRLKIDRSFTSGMLKDDIYKTLVEKIIELSRALNIEVTVEGIETESQGNFLRKYEGICVQGYLFGQPSRIGSLSFAKTFDETGNFWTANPVRSTISNIVVLSGRLREN